MLAPQSTTAAFSLWNARHTLGLSYLQARGSIEHCHVQAGEALFKGPLGVMGNVLRHEGGVLGLFRGLVPTLLREVPGNAAYFGLYDLSKRQLAEWQVGK